MADKLVTADWVAEHGADANVRLVEVDVDTGAYDEGHIAGAVGWNWATQLQDQVQRDVISKGDLEELLGASGIGNDTHVVLYGDNNNWFAAYALWLLELYGHEQVSLMDGGRVKWIADGREITTDAPSVGRASYSASEQDAGLRAQRDEVLTAVPTPNPSIGAADPTSSAMRCSSRSPLASTWVSAHAPASRIARTARLRGPRSPLSSLTPPGRRPASTMERAAARGS